MKLKPEDIRQLDEKKPLELFGQSIKSERTRYVYERKLRQILCEYMEDILHGEFEERAAELLSRSRENPKWACGLMLQLARALRERTALGKDDPEYLSPTSINTNFAPLQKMFGVNDVALPWKLIRATFPEMETYDTQGWTRDDIRKMLRHARGAIDRAVILVMASSGVRIGGMVLKWRDIVPIYHEGGDFLEGSAVLEEHPSKPVACARLRVYGSTYAEYATFITPEAYEAVQDYRTVWAQEAGLEPELDSPFLKKAGPSVVGLTHNGIRQRVYKAIWSAGLRGSEVKEGKRYNVPGMNGFRRFCNKAMKDAKSDDAPLASLIKKERMMGHKGLIKLDENYFKTDPMELAKEYLHAVPNLTIHETVGERSAVSLASTTVGVADAKPSRMPDHGATTDTGGGASREGRLCPNCGRTTRQHAKKEFEACLTLYMEQCLAELAEPRA